jgi:hypothetical protein
MENEVTKNAYLAFRYIEGICIAVFVFGFLWEGTEILKLSLPEFMMLYGGVGAILSEGLARLFHKLLKKKITTKGKKEATPSGSQ